MQNTISSHKRASEAVFQTPRNSRSRDRICFLRSGYVASKRSMVIGSRFAFTSFQQGILGACSQDCQRVWYMGRQHPGMCILAQAANIKACDAGRESARAFCVMMRTVRRATARMNRVTKLLCRLSFVPAVTVFACATALSQTAAGAQSDQKPSQPASVAGQTASSTSETKK